MEDTEFDKMIKSKEFISYRNDLRNKYNIHICLEESYDFYNLVNDYSKLNYSERPDMYVQHDNFIIGIEDFRFSAYPEGKKGNVMNKTIAENDKNTHDEYTSTGNNHYSNYINIEMNKNNYETNFIRNFDNHYNKIKEYKMNLNGLNTNNKIVFLIRDDTIDGAGIYNNNDYLFYNPTMNYRILNYLKDKSDVYGFIFKTNLINGVKQYLYLENKPEKIANLLKKNNSFFNCEIVQEGFSRHISYYNLGDEE